jgi:hypothetical protein
MFKSYLIFLLKHEIYYLLVEYYTVVVLDVLVLLLVVVLVLEILRAVILVVGVAMVVVVVVILMNPYFSLHDTQQGERLSTQTQKAKFATCRHGYKEENYTHKENTTRHDPHTYEIPDASGIILSHTQMLKMHAGVNYCCNVTWTKTWL